MLSAGSSEQGNVRGNNEDRIHIDDARGIYMVVDGMGGQAAGEHAAEIAVRTLRARLERPTETPDVRIREAIALANNAIYEAAADNPEWNGMACVLTVALVEEGAVTVGHVGDSRLYLIENGSIEKVTSDHSPVGEREDAGDLSEAAAMKHPRRNEVYRDVGSAPRTPDDSDFIEIRSVRFPSDGAMLLCSDGLSDVVPAKRIKQLVEEHAGDCAEAVDRLIGEAVAAGKDNVSVVLVEGNDFKPASPAPVAVPAPLETQPPRSAWQFLVGGVLLGAGVMWAALHLLAPAPPRAPRVIRVAAQGGDTASVPEAMARAEVGDTIELAPGDYPERILLRDGVVIRGKDGARITGGLIADGISHASLSSISIAPFLRIRNSSIDLDHVQVSAVEFLGSAGGSLRGSRITGSPGIGIAVEDQASPLIENNYIAHNGGAGIEWSSTAAPRIQSNAIAGNGAEALWLRAQPGTELLAANVLEPAKHPFRILAGEAKP